MKIDSHVLFLIIVIGVISAGIVGATVMNTDTSMKQEVFDGIKVLVPADSEFVKVGDGVYKDSNHGITINTFKNNNSMIDFLKNTKKSKIVPIENQPPQSVAFKKGKTINILVTNGNEGIAIGSEDGKLTSEIANNVVFSNNHKTQKPVGLPFAKQPMEPKQDFNLIMLLVAKVDTNIFNVNALQENTAIIVDDYNVELNEPADISVDDASKDSSDDSSDSGVLTDTEELSDVNNTDDLNDVLNEPVDTSDDDKSSADNDAQTTDVSSDSSQPSSSGNAAGGDTISSPASSSGSSSSSSSSGSSSSSSSSSGSSSSGSSSSSSSQQQKLSESDCQQIVQQSLMNHPELQIDRCQASGDTFVFYIVDAQKNNAPVGTITVDALTGNVEPDSALNSAL